MKRTTIYWLLLFGLLIGISYLYSGGANRFDQPFINKKNNKLFGTIENGDLYVLKKEDQTVREFFKITGNPKADSVYVLQGNPSYNSNFTNKEWVTKIIDRPIYFESELRKVAKGYLESLADRQSDFTIYRQHYPADQYPLIMHLMYSPLVILLLILIALYIIWVADTISLYLSSFFTKVPKSLFLYLIGFSISALIGWIQWNGYTTYLVSQELPMPEFILLPTVVNSLLQTFPIFLVFQWVKKKYLKRLEFADEEFGKFATIFLAGVLLSLLADTLFYLIVPTFGIPAINYYALNQMGYSYLVQKYVFIWGVIAIANFLNNLRKNWRGLRQKAQQLAKSQQATLTSQSALDALQAKINPHFLYNSLNSIASLAQTNPAKTEEMALALSDFYKHTTNRQEEHMSTVKAEMQQLETYLNIEKIRFGKRLQYELAVDEAIKEVEIPRFLLQPLVENAIKYGFDKAIDKIKILVKLEKVNEQLHIRIKDSGPAFSGQLNTGYGLRSVKKILKLVYPKRHEIQFLNEPEKQVFLILNE